MSHKETVQQAFHGKGTYIPTCFARPWLAPKDEQVRGERDAEFLEDVIKHHQDYIRIAKPDIVKIMTAGFFIYPGFDNVDFHDLSTLRSVRPLGPEHPWIEKQVYLSREIAKTLGDSGVLLYNIFSPMMYLRTAAGAHGVNEADLTALLWEQRETFAHVSSVLREDLSALAQAVLRRGSADGIYFCTNNLLTQELTQKYSRELIAPDERAILETAAGLSDYNVLHICGNDRKNDFTIYQDYPVAVYNWASTKEGVSLAKGKQYFPGKVVLGGFDNVPWALLHEGSEEEIKAETVRILSESGRDHVILGADCALPPSLDNRHLEWVREAANRGGETA